MDERLSYNSYNSVEENVNLDEIIEAKKCCITFTKFNKYMLYPFLSSIFAAQAYYIAQVLLMNKGIKRKEFYTIILNVISNIIVGLVYFIPCFMEKNNKNDNKIKNIPNKEKPKNKIKVIFIFSIICIAYIISILILGFNQSTDQMLLFIIIFITIFSKFILKEALYKHHYLSFAIDILGVIMALIPNYLGFTKDKLINYLFDVINGLCIALIYVLLKYSSQVYYISIFKIGFLFGIVTTIITIIGFIIYSLSKYHDLTYFNECFDFSEVENVFMIIGYLLLVLLFFVISQLFIFLSLFNYSPTLLIITQIISPLLFFIVNVIYAGPIMPDIVVCSIGYFIALFSSLVFNEIIILNFCGLNKNTKKFVNERINLELLQISKSSKYDEKIVVELSDKSDKSKEYKVYFN